MGIEEVVICPVCESNSFTHKHTSKDYTATDELFHVKQCNGCGLLVTSPRPSLDTAHRYYQSKHYISHTATASGLLDSIYLIIRQFTMRWKFSLIRPYLLGGILLDYGCGTGNFLQEALKHNCTVYGIEPSLIARQKISPVISVTSSLEELPPTHFNVITLWHVLEHVYPLRETLRKLKTLLADRGTIIIAVPNWESNDARVYQEHWAAYDVPRHLWHFSKQSMTALLKNEGLTIKKIIPMNLDAFYVSLLSKKNSNGGRLTPQGSISAVWTAFVSNLKGSREKNQSSLIYVVQK